jgi:hypothetical protein
LLIGGASQAFLWRSGLAAMADVTNSQFMWVLLTFAAAWAYADGRIAHGVAAGSLTGLALIASYYAFQWLADGRHSALAQFSKTGAPAVIVAVGPAAWILVNSEHLDVARLAPAVTVFLLVGIALFLVAVRTCGPAASLQALAVSVGIGAVALAGLLVLETTGWLYLTF